MPNLLCSGKDTVKESSSPNAAHAERQTVQEHCRHPGRALATGVSRARPTGDPGSAQEAGGLHARLDEQSIAAFGSSREPREGDGSAGGSLAGDEARSGTRLYDKRTDGIA